MDGIKMIAAERERQVSEEGRTPEHDDSHRAAELASAAAVYALPKERVGRSMLLDLWPFGWQDWKPCERVRELVKAGALIAAEIDRLHRDRADQEEER